MEEQKIIEYNITFPTSAFLNTTNIAPIDPQYYGVMPRMPLKKADEFVFLRQETTSIGPMYVQSGHRF
jgi:hypothetical protein